MSENELPKNIVSLVRKLYPHKIAQDIVDVQPMTHLLDPVPLEIGTETSVSGIVWYWVQPAQAAALDFTDPRNSPQYWQKIEDWCFDNFGPRNIWAQDDDSGCWCASAGKYYFRNQEDRLIFILRWH